MNDVLESRSIAKIDLSQVSSYVPSFVEVACPNSISRY